MEPSKDSIKNPVTPKIKKKKSQKSSTNTSNRGSLELRKTIDTNNIRLSSLDKTTDEGDKFSIVNSIRKYIVDSALEEVQEKYLEKQTIYFVSHCSELAWKALVEWNYQSKDKGGFHESDVELLDIEPDPSPKDSWCGHSVPIAKPSPVVKTEMEATKTTLQEKSEDSKHVFSKMIDSVVDTKTEATKAALSDMLEDSKQVFNEIIESMRHSITQSRRMSNKSEKSNHANCLKKKMRTFEEQQHVPQIKVSSVKTAKEGDLPDRSCHELPKPVVMQAKHFPSSRVNVHYAITPSGRDHTKKKGPNVKKIYLTQPVNADTNQ